MRGILRCARRCVADARITAAYRGERDAFTSRLDAAAQMLRLAFVSDAYLGQALYRLKASLQARGVPGLPRIAHRLAMAVSQISIGDPVLVHPGVYLIHGQVVIDGLVEIHPGAVIAPFVTIGLRAGDVQGATIERNASIGTGAKVIGAGPDRGGRGRRGERGRGRRRPGGRDRRRRTGAARGLTPCVPWAHVPPPTPPARIARRRGGRRAAAGP